MVHLRAVGVAWFRREDYQRIREISDDEMHPTFEQFEAKMAERLPRHEAPGIILEKVIVDPEGQHAVTEYRVLGMHDGRAWLELRPRTGRTHQVRVHCATLSSPIVGDIAYGGPGEVPLHLHARAQVLISKILVA